MSTNFDPEKFTNFSKRNLQLLQNFILYIGGENKYNQTAIEYIAEDHVDGEDSPQAELEREQSNKKICIYYWRASRADLELLGYDPQQEFPYSEAKVCEIILDVINKGYNVQTRQNKEFFTICIDKGNFKQS